MHDSTRERPREPVKVLAEELYRREHGFLFAIARRNSKGGVDAEAALHDAFAYFIERFDPDCDSPPLAWLTLTLKRRCWALNDRLARARRHTGRSALESADAATTADPVESLARLEDARAALGATKPAERRALSLRAFGYSHREICGITGWSARKVGRSIYEGGMAVRNFTETCPSSGRLEDASAGGQEGTGECPKGKVVTRTDRRLHTPG